VKREGAAAAGILALFFAFRIPLLLVRQLFFDELFTRWISGKSFAGIVDALRYDSGPPLYYFLVHLFGHARGISLLASLATVIVLLMRKQFFAAAFVAVFPPSVLFAADGRAYALCAFFVTIALTTPSPSGRGGREAPGEGRASYPQAIAFVLAAYSHFYGVLFFPLLVRKPKALALAALLFAPGFWLAAQQPAGAREWMTHAWPDALFVRPPVALAIIGVLALLWVCVAPAILPARRRGENAPAGLLAPHRGAYLAAVLVPLVLAIVLRVYVPLRFESVIAAPLALWIAESLRAQRGALREAFATFLLGVAAIWSVLGIIDHASRPPDDYRSAAVWLARNAPRQERVVASGYLYLETIMNGCPDALAFPAEQAIHPGWRAFARSTEPAPQAPFVWIGEQRASELVIAGRKHRIEPLYANVRAMVARIR
jgi:hypothetical protein